MNKKVALISSFCDTEEKLNVLKENIKKIKSFLDIILISPVNLPDEIVKACDYVFYTKDNPILEWPLKTQLYYFQPSRYDTIFLYTVNKNYGWAGLSQVKKLTEIALTFDYEYFYHMIYDLEIDDKVVSIFKEQKENWIGSFHRGEVKTESSLHLMVFNVENVKKLKNLITLESYLDFLNLNSNADASAEAFVETMRRNLKSERSDFFIKDKIHITNNIFNHSETNDLSFFIEKNSRNNTPEVRIYFYRNESIANIKIVMNDKITELDISKCLIFSSGVNIFDLESAYILLSDKKIEILNLIKSIKHSEIVIE